MIHWPFRPSKRLQLPNTMTGPWAMECLTDFWWCWHTCNLHPPIHHQVKVVITVAVSFMPSDFSKTVERGGPVSHRTGAGLNISVFAPAYKLHFKQQKRTLTQQYTLIGTRLDNSVTIITRHDDRNASQQQARIDNVVYDVADCSPDDSNNAIRYDYLTLLKITKGA